MEETKMSQHLTSSLKGKHKTRKKINVYNIEKNVGTYRGMHIKREIYIKQNNTRDHIMHMQKKNKDTSKAHAS